jgi:GNAT superfamily N-acetyltransferase
LLLTFDQAAADDLSVVLDILDEAARWLHEREIEQWPAQFGGVDDWRSARIAGYVNAGQTWLVRIGGEPVATFNLTDQADPDYVDGWPDGPGNALYIFRMAVRRVWAGRDLGSRILDWASSRAKREGVAWLRLDCHRHNRALQRYYEDRGFIHVGTLVRTIDDNGQPYTRGSGALYQRPAGAVQLFPHRGGDVMSDRYDPTGEAAIWYQASQLVNSLKRYAEDDDQLRPWNSALDQAARMLENEGRGIRQTNGMYSRVISGQHARPRADDEQA